MNNPWGDITGIRPVKIIRSMLEDGFNEQQAYDYFTNQHNVSVDKAKLSMQIAHKELAILNSINDNDICVYIGVPFCKTKCLYCSFVTNSTTTTGHLIQPFVEALIKEIKYTSDIIKEAGFNIVSLYIGGGTPTTLSAIQLTEVIENCYRFFDLSNLKEFTVEAGRPDTIDKEKLVALKKSGVTRISINPQTMNDKTLSFVGRRHTSKDIIECFNLARDIGFDDINMDLIAGLPNETLDDFMYSVKEVEKLNPESTTVHTMCIKRGSKLQETLHVYTLTDGNTVADMVDFSYKYITGNNKNPYYLYRQKNILGNLENVGYAKEGYECLYNIMIMEEKSSIISLGSGGVTKIVNRKSKKIERIFNVKEVYDYISRIDEMCARKDTVIHLLS